MDPFNWQCPHCQHKVTITVSRYSVDTHILTIENASGRRALRSEFVVCPNPECRKFTLIACLFEQDFKGGEGYANKHPPLEIWELVPASSARSWPDYVPEAVRADYLEACLIRNLSPKSAATLARRCLQGILRDF
jgi:hypothetical protein